MDVKKIFIVLIVVVACVMIGALVLNTLMPNVVSSMINAVEAMVHNATGMAFDWNNDGTGGADSDDQDFTDSGYAYEVGEEAGMGGDAVTGFEAA